LRFRALESSQNTVHLLSKPSPREETSG
jgi:hypothetical protein